jgi:FkbM family methyltransferase
MNNGDVQQWFNDNGDHTLRLNYNLNENSLVFDLGGYKGDWSNSIAEKYNPHIYIFEPIPNLYQNIIERFKYNKKIKVFNHGLSDNTNIKKISLLNDGSSFYKETENAVECKVINIIDFINLENISFIDLMKINIEGDEFPVLTSLLNQNMTPKINDIQVQFHDFYPNAIELRNEIQKKLTKTHKLTYNYDFVWENWQKII